MSDTLQVNSGIVDEAANKINGASQYLTGQGLSSADEKSTITAVNNSSVSFKNSQTLVTSLGATLNQEAENIRSLGVAFKEFDEMMGELHRIQ